MTVALLPNSSLASSLDVDQLARETFPDESLVDLARRGFHVRTTDSGQTQAGSRTHLQLFGGETMPNIREVCRILCARAPSASHEARGSTS